MQHDLEMLSFTLCQDPLLVDVLLRISEVSQGSTHLCSSELALLSLGQPCLKAEAYGEALLQKQP